MAQIDYFDPSKVEPAQPFDTIPPGDYVAQIVKSDMEDTTTGGRMLVLEFDVLEGEFANRKLWARLNLVNSSAQAVQIAQRELSAICHAINSPPISDSEALHFQPMIITVKVQPGGRNERTGKEFGPKNEIKGYKAVAGGTRTAAPARQTSAQPAPAGQTAPAAQTAQGAGAAPAGPAWRRNRPA
jgi:hypothetical protein